jgi:glycosyltransferase involved in cell wall biosynthesis
LQNPDLTIVLVTYDRPLEIRKTVQALLDHIVYDGNLIWHLADDGSPGDYVENLRRDFPLNWHVTVTNRGGWGLNVNTAFEAIDTDLVFLIEDDYVSKYPVNLTAGAALLEACPTLDIVRYDGLEGHLGLNLWISEQRTDRGVIPYMLIDTEKSMHLNCYSNRPHLRHIRLHERVGLYATEQPLGLTEEMYAHAIKSADPQCGVAVLDDGIRRAFDHIGVTRQGTSQDPHKGKS